MSTIIYEKTLLWSNILHLFHKVATKYTLKSVQIYMAWFTQVLIKAKFSFDFLIS